MLRLLSLLLLSPLVAAQPTQPLDELLLQRYERLLQNEDLRQQAIDKGRERAVLCRYCHGEDGNGGPGDTPILAGQNPVYLLHQMDRFASGERKRFVMERLAKNFSDEDKVNLALYYASVEMKPAAFDPVQAQRGKLLFEDHCTLCHGHDGRGTQGYARIAGQKPEYVQKTLLGFRRDDEQRFSPEMQAIAKALTETEIEQVAHFVASLGHDD